MRRKSAPGSSKAEPGLPLAGRTVLITRTREQAGTLAGALEERGASCVLFPVIRIEPPEDFGPLDEAIARLESYHGILFTSANAVPFFRSRLEACGRDTGALGKAWIAAIGPATAAAVESLGVRCRYVAREFQAEGLAEVLQDEPLEGKRILLPRAAQAREVLPRALAKRGAQVDVVAAYRTVPDSEKAPEVLDLLRSRRLDLLTFTSSSTVRHFHDLVGREAGTALEDVRVVCIGPITAGTARDLGYRVDAVPPRFTIPDLVQECVRLLS